MKNSRSAKDLAAFFATLERLAAHQSDAVELDSLALTQKGLQ